MADVDVDVDEVDEVDVDNEEIFVLVSLALLFPPRNTIAPLVDEFEVTVDESFEDDDDDCSVSFIGQY